MSIENNQLGQKFACINRMLKRNADQLTLKYGLTVEQGRLIVYLYKNNDKDIYMKDLEEIFHTRKSSLTSLLNNLEKNKYITRLVLKSDQRLKKIVLTDLGNEKAKLLVDSFKTGDNELFSSLSNEESAELSKLLDKLINSMCEKN